MPGISLPRFVREHKPGQFLFDNNCSSGQALYGFAQYLPDIFTEDKAGIANRGSLIPIDQYDVFAAKIANKPGGGIDRKGGPADDQKICGGDSVDGGADHLLI